jgi:hypothetical protein
MTMTTTTLLPPVSRDRQVGTEAFPYKLSDLARVRRRSIQRHMFEDHAADLRRSRAVVRAPDEGHDMILVPDTKKRAAVMAILRSTALSLKRRIGLIRIYLRNHRSACRKLTADMAWIDREYLGRNASTSRDVCA